MEAKIICDYRSQISDRSREEVLQSVPDLEYPIQAGSYVSWSYNGWLRNVLNTSCKLFNAPIPEGLGR